MHKQRSLICLVAVVGMLGTFLPWVTLPFVGTVYGTAGDGWITLGLFVIGERSEPLQMGGMVVGSLLSLLAAGLGYSKISTFMKLINQPADEPIAQAMSANISIGIGLYIICAAGVALPIVALALRSTEQSVVSAEV